MSHRELTAQQTDPLGALNQRPVTLVVTVFALLLAVGRTVLHGSGRVDMMSALLALAFVAAATAAMIASTSPVRAPFTRRSFSLIVACGILALIAEAVSKDAGNTIIRDNWGSSVLGLLLLASAPYRPGRDLVAGTMAGAVVEGVVAFLQAPGFDVPAPAILYIVIGLTPLIALGLGGAVYSSTFVRLVQQWLDHATAMTKESTLEMRPGITQTVQQDRVAGLNRDVVPFFSDLVERDQITDDDRRRAGQVAAVLRERIVAESDRSWLEQAMIDVCPPGLAGTVVDRSQLAIQMSSDQRTALRALLTAMADDSVSDTATLAIVLHDDAPVVRVLIRIDTRSSETVARQPYAPYFAVLRIMFQGLHVDVTGSFLTLRFSYDQH